MQLKPIDQQVVAVVGASSGIGRETAIQLAARGAKLVVSARSEPGLDSLVDEIRQIGGEAIAVPADVTNFEQVQAIARSAPAKPIADQDTLLLQTGAGFKLQQTSEPKSEDAPDNLFEPIAGFDRVEGDLSNQSRANSYSTWLETHPTAKWGAIAVTVLGAVGLAVMAG